PIAFHFPLLLFYETAERPSVDLTPEVDDRLVNTYAVDRQTPGDQIERVVIEADVLDRDNRLPVHRDADVLHLDPEEQVAFELFDGQRAVQVLVGLRHDVAPEPVLEPRRLRHDDRRRRGANHQGDDDDERLNQPPDNLHAPVS